MRFFINVDVRIIDELVVELLNAIYMKEADYHCQLNLEWANVHVMGMKYLTMIFHKNLCTLDAVVMSFLEMALQ